ncbi:hypothetical protein BDP27DRAFT_33104 [Rhodocollybia butyracea]|uniref:Uncharacterized protein n=1 Tax=Rhodocollybia butyracea TaxID=206335 RepID=A0A9P5UDE6_9AGAR|nr:hypothetical protein BDP27DRAFT_33104 [Rhodocollybia butyracea]
MCWVDGEWWYTVIKDGVEVEGFIGKPREGLPVMQGEWNGFLNRFMKDFKKFPAINPPATAHSALKPPVTGHSVTNPPTTGYSAWNPPTTGHNHGPSVGNQPAHADSATKSDIQVPISNPIPGQPKDSATNPPTGYSAWNPPTRHNHGSPPFVGGQPAQAASKSDTAQVSISNPIPGQPKEVSAKNIDPMRIANIIR